MAKRSRKRNKKLLKVSFWVTLFFGVSFAYFIWLSWERLTYILGNSTTVWIITGLIVLAGIVFGKLGFDRIVEEFV